MATINFSELIPEILAAAPTCPTPTAVRALRTAARNLCEEASCYRHDIGNVVVPANVPQISLDVPTNTVLHKPITLTLDGKFLTATSTTLLDGTQANWRTQTGAPSYYYRAPDDMDDIILVPKPQNTYSTVGLRGTVSVKPTRTATQVDEIFLDQYQDVIIDGALGALLMVRSAPWYEPNLAAFHIGAWNRGLLDSKARAENDDMYKGKLIQYGGI